MVARTLPLSQTRKSFFYPILMLAMLGAASIWLATFWGIGVSPDSIVYIAGAGSLLDGHGFSLPLPGENYAPITHYPPFYSTLLALIAASGVTPALAARWLAIALFLVNILLVAWIVYNLRYPTSVKPTAIALIAATLALSSTTLLDIHSMAWTEPPFILLGLVAFVLLARVVEAPDWRILALSALLVGFAVLTRYAGIAYVAAGALSVLLFSKSSFAARLRNTVLFGVLAILPFIPWILRNLTSAGTATNRVLSIQPLRLSHLQEAISAFSSWFLLSNSLPSLVKAAGLLILFALIMLPYVRALKSDPSSTNHNNGLLGAIPPILRIFLLFIPIYLATIVATNMALEVYTPFDYRILSPILIPILILTLYSGAMIYHRFSTKSHLIRPLAMVSIVLVCAIYLFQGSRFVQRAYTEGLGFNSSWWHNSEILRRLDSLPAATDIYSNAPEAVYLHTGRPADKLPRELKSINGEANPDYETELRALHQAVEGGGVIILFELPWRNSSDDEQNLTTELPLHVIHEASDGRIFAIDR